MNELGAAIFKTIIYADVFDFPLKSEEIFRFLITNKRIPSQRLVRLWRKKLIKVGKIQERNGFYFLKGKKKTVKRRQRKEKESRKKLKIARRMTQVLRSVPTVKMVAVTGALAMENAKKEDDIDLLIVSKEKRIWTTRFLVTMMAEIFASRRRPGEEKYANKICLNMFLDEDHLAVPERERDLYSAHEVVQLRPLWDKDETYKKFLVANQWVKQYLPNAIKKCETQSVKLKTTAKNLKPIRQELLALSCNFTLYALRFTLIENVLRHFQLFYMNRRRTTEVVSDDIIRFHPQDARGWVLKEYQKRVDSLKEQ